MYATPYNMHTGYERTRVLVFKTWYPQQLHDAAFPLGHAAFPLVTGYAYKNYMHTGYARIRVPGPTSTIFVCIWFRSIQSHCFVAQPPLVPVPGMHT